MKLFPNQNLQKKKTKNNNYKQKPRKLPEKLF